MESEAATSAVMQAIEVLFQKTDRISKLSHDSLSALREVKNNLHQSGQEKFSAQDIAHLTKNLADLAKDHGELAALTSPIIEALQFQDRLRHRLSNIVKMTKVWLECRQEFSNHDNPADFLAEIGDRMRQQTTSPDEREILRRYFVGMKDEASLTEAVNLF